MCLRHSRYDVRVPSLQALVPITAPDEMNLSEADLVTRLSGIAEHWQKFAAAFPDAGVSVAPTEFSVPLW